MRLAILFLASLLAAPALAEPGLHGAPELEVLAHAAGNRLQWSLSADAPGGQAVAAVEIWRYEEGGPDALGVRVDGVGTWAVYDTANGQARTFIDHDPAADDETYYFVRVVYEDGSVSPPSDPGSVKYPHCHWIYVAVPPQTEVGCLFPIPTVAPPGGLTA